jgi:hypothetical protein
MVAITWLGDRQGKPTAPTIDKLHMVRYQVLHYITSDAMPAGIWIL